MLCVKYRASLWRFSARRAGGVDLQEGERLLEFMEKHGLEEFEYERSGFRIRLRKPFSQPTGFSRAVSAPDIVVAGPSIPVSSAHGPTSGAPGAREASGEQGRAGSEDVHVVKSPIVGTFYAAPTVGGEPFERLPLAGKRGLSIDEEEVGIEIEAAGGGDRRFQYA